nr:hypothetical protein [Tanacetum cinerariifolium]
PRIKARTAAADFRFSVRAVERGRSAALEIEVMVKVAKTVKQQALSPVNVGSDHVHKVMDNFNMVQSLASMSSAHDVMPLYSAGGNGPYHRSMDGQPYPQLDTKFAYSQLDAKPSYASEWAVSYGEGASPVNKYSFDQPATYLPSSTTPAGSNMYGSSYRWAHPAGRQNQ